MNQISKFKDRQTQINKQIDRHKKVDRQTQIDRQIDRYIDRHRQIDRQMIYAYINNEAVDNDKMVPT